MGLPHGGLRRGESGADAVGSVVGGAGVVVGVVLRDIVYVSVDVRLTLLAPAQHARCASINVVVVCTLAYMASNPAASSAAFFGGVILITILGIVIVDRIRGGSRCSGIFRLRGLAPSPKKKRVAVGVVGVAFLLLRPLNPARMAMTMAREIIVVRGAALVALGN